MNNLEQYIGKSITIETSMYSINSFSLIREIENFLDKNKTYSILVQFEDGDKLSLSYANIMLGICDDCKERGWDANTILLKVVDLDEKD